MKKMLLLIAMIPLLIGCGKNTSQSESSKEYETTMTLFIDEQQMNITWEDNSSTQALDELGELTIEMHRYGGFEQVGSIGHTLPSDDKEITTSYGDVVLYSSNQLVIFYGSNTWAYTKLGHINMSQSELTSLLDKENVTVLIK